MMSSPAILITLIMFLMCLGIILVIMMAVIKAMLDTRSPTIPLLSSTSSATFTMSSTQLKAKSVASLEVLRLLSTAEKAARLAVLARTAPTVMLLLAVEVSWERRPILCWREPGQTEADCDKC